MSYFLYISISESEGSNSGEYVSQRPMPQAVPNQPLAKLSLRLNLIKLLGAYLGA